MNIFCRMASGVIEEGVESAKIGGWNLYCSKKQNDPKLFLPFPYLRQPEVLLGLFGADEELAVVMDLHHGDAPPPAIVLLLTGKEIRLLLLHRAEVLSDGTYRVVLDELAFFQFLGDGGKDLLLLFRS